MRKQNSENSYSMKIDDILISLIRDYHNVVPAEVISFFGSLVDNTIKTEGNIANDKTKLVKAYSKKNPNGYRRIAQPTQQTVLNPFNNSPFQVTGIDDMLHIWVVRGYYPETKIPFKLSVVKNLSFTDAVHANVRLGLKDKAERFSSEKIIKYHEAVAESELLDVPIDEETLEYKTKKFKCMRPQGIALFPKGK